ncbi:hypothetical protein ACQ4PT_021196 [Festuca glaucescens]
MMSRAFLYMVVERCRPPVQPVYMVHRINASRLFFSDKDDQRLQAVEAAEIKARLPRPALSLFPSVNFPIMDFVLFGRNKDKMVAMDYHGRTVLYDDALRAVSALPSMKEFKFYNITHPMSAALPVGDDLFVMNNLPLCYSSSTSVRALINNREPHMLWQSIPPPPYVKPEDEPAGSFQNTAEAYTVVGESQVWVSAESCGTYSLDMKNFWYDHEGNETRRGEWSKVWDQAPIDSFLVHLGASGRFCIAKFSHNWRGPKAAMLTGVEVTHCSDGEGLRLVKHKTYRYGLGEDDPICIL